MQIRYRPRMLGLFTCAPGGGPMFVMHSVVTAVVHGGIDLYSHSVVELMAYSSQKTPKIPRSRQSSGVLSRSSWLSWVFLALSCQGAVGRIALAHRGGSSRNALVIIRINAARIIRVVALLFDVAIQIAAGVDQLSNPRFGR